MPIPDTRSRQRLAAMGIELWRQRGARPESTGEPENHSRPAIRLASGNGRWLLVQREAWRGSHASLVDDITATIGREDCRFGQWASDSTAGCALDELAERGVDQVLSFGPPPADPGGQPVLEAPPLDELAASAEARRALWQLLAPRVRG